MTRKSVFLFFSTPLLLSSRLSFLQKSTLLVDYSIRLLIRVVVVGGDAADERLCPESCVKKNEKKKEEAMRAINM